MLKLLFSAYKRRGIIVFILLFFVLAGTFLPSIVLAQAAQGNTLCNIAGWLVTFSPAGQIISYTTTGRGLGTNTQDNCNDIYKIIDGSTVTALTLQTIARGLKEFSDLFSATEWKNVPAFIVKVIADLLSVISYLLAKGSSELFRFIINRLIEDPKLSITRPESATGLVSLKAWNIVKGYANMLIVIGLIAAALMIMLRLWADRGKKLLSQVIIVALLVNFSILFVGLMIDTSNIVMRTFTVGADQEANLVININDAWNNIIWPIQEFAEEDFNTAMQYFVLNLLFDALYIIVALTLLYFTLIILQRYIILAILFVLSPLAFVLKILPFPAANKLSDDWWRNFLKNCFVGVGAVFFLMLSVNVLETFQWSFDKNQTTANNLVSLVFTFILVIAFLIAGLRIAVKSAGPIVNAVMAAAAAIGAAIITGGTSLTMTGAGAALKALPGGNKIQGAMRKGIDSVSDNRVVNQLRDVFRGTGASAMRRQNIMQARLKEPTERLSNITDDRRGNAQLANVAVNGRTAAERAAATNILKERGSLSSIAQPHRQAAMRNAIAHDNKLKESDFAKSDYRYAGFDNAAVTRAEEIIQRQHIATGAPALPINILRQRAEAQVRQAQLVENIPGMSRKQRQNIDARDITEELLINRNVTPNMIRDLRGSDDDHIRAASNNTVIRYIISQIRSAPTRGEQNRLRNILREAYNLRSLL